MRGQLSNEANRGVAQLASASGLGPEGPVFESLYPDKKADRNPVSLFLFPPVSPRHRIVNFGYQVQIFGLKYMVARLLPASL